MENKETKQTTSPSDIATLILERLDELKKLAKSVFTVEDAADYMGCSVLTVRRYMYSGALPYSKPTGGRVYISRADLDAFLVRGRVSSLSEIEEQAGKY